MAETALVISCEHAVNTVPPDFEELFAGQEGVLTTHRGYDQGALALAKTLANSSQAPCFAARISRLLIDHNRSPNNRSFWSEFSRDLSPEQKHQLLAGYYQPFRDLTSEWINQQVLKGKAVLHLSVHSFTPVCTGRIRDLDIGLLYDPNRGPERAFAKHWQRHLRAAKTELRVKMNRPYHGMSDCHQAIYRLRYPAETYWAIELEVNQALINPGKTWCTLQRLLMATLEQSLGDCRS